MKLYFGNAVTAATTLILLALLGFVGYSIYNRDNIQYWGRRSTLLLTFGLVTCCFAAGPSENGTAWIRRFSTPSTAAARRDCSH